MLDEYIRVSEERAKGRLVENDGIAANLSEREFDELAERIICVATANGVLPSDALAALAKALGTLSSFTARREDISLKAVLGTVQAAVSTFAMQADVYMSENPDTAPEILST